MYACIITAGYEAKIHTPGVDYSQVHSDIVAKPGFICMKSDYPNGLHLEFEEYPDHIVVHSNRKLTQNEDGSFTAPTNESHLGQSQSC